MRRVAIALAVGFGLGLFQGRAEAGPHRRDTRIAVDPKREGSPAVEIGAELVQPASSTTLGWGSIRVEVDNRTDAPRNVEIKIGDEQGTQRGSLRLAAGETATSYFAARGTDATASIQIDCPGLGKAELSLFSYSVGRGYQEIVILDAQTSSGARREWDGEFEGLWRAIFGSTGGKPSSAVVAPDLLPERWTLLTSADAIVIDGEPMALSVEQQRALVRYMSAGGTLILSRVPFAGVSGPGSLADLRDVSFDVVSVEEGTTGAATKGRYGLGRWVATRGAAAGHPLVREAMGALLKRRVGQSGAETGVLPSHASARLEIPGLGDVSVRAFFAWIALFALLVGVAVLVLQRRFGRRTALVVVVPVLGLLFTGSILAYGLLSEGLGIRGVVRTFSFLDQRHHDAVSTASRTLYAGIAPDSLRLSPDTLLSPPNAAATGRRRWGRYDGGDSFAPVDVHWSAAGGVVDGSMLASRTPTGIATATVVRARERLRFQGRGDGYEVLSDASFSPVPGRGGVLFRHLDGQYFLREADGRCARIPADHVAGAIDAVLGRFRTVDLESNARDGSDDEWSLIHSGYTTARAGRVLSTGPSEPPTDWLGAAIGTTLPPGSYLALTTSAPGFDTLGLTVTYERETHVVFGLLAAEDVDD